MHFRHLCRKCSGSPYEKMKRLTAILFLISSLFVPTSYSQQGAVTIGFMWEIMSRGGFTLGYNLTDDVGIEFHLGGAPHVMTYGATAKIRIADSKDDQYALVGLTRMMFDSPHGRETPWYNGLNLGYRYEFGGGGRQTAYPVEIGFCPILWETPRGTNAITTTNSLPCSAFIGGGIQWSTKEAK
jgi:hypothetical protein